MIKIVFYFLSFLILLFSELFAQDVIFFEPDPQHGEIIVDFELRDVESLAADIFGQMLQEVDDFAFAGGRAAGEDDDVEGGF